MRRFCVSSNIFNCSKDASSAQNYAGTGEALLLSVVVPEPVASVERTASSSLKASLNQARAQILSDVQDTGMAQSGTAAEPTLFLSMAPKPLEWDVELTQKPSQGAEHESRTVASLPGW